MKIIYRLITIRYCEIQYRSVAQTAHARLGLSFRCKMDTGVLETGRITAARTRAVKKLRKRRMGGTWSWIIAVESMQYDVPTWHLPWGGVRSSWGRYCSPGSVKPWLTGQDRWIGPTLAHHPVLYRGNTEYTCTIPYWQRPLHTLAHPK